MKKLDEHRIVTQIIERFDFEKVRKTMRALKWKWHVPGTKNDYEIPSTKRLIASATKLLTDLLNGDSILSIDSGGFTVSRTKNEDGDSFTLEFIIESSEISK